MTAPLAGRRIVVTRAERQSGGLRERLERQGAEVLLLPTIQIVPPHSYAPLDAALRLPQQFHWLVVTSVNAVRVIGERLTALGLRVESLAQLRCAAVGPSTAEALRGLGLAVEVVPERYVGEALAAALANRVRGQRVLLVRAAVARDVVPQSVQGRRRDGHDCRCVSHGCSRGCGGACEGYLWCGSVAGCCGVHQRLYGDASARCAA